MRNINHLLCESKTGKSAILKIELNDSLGRKTVNFTSVKGWRKDLALKYLQFESKEWDESVIRIFVGLEVLKCSKDMHEGIKFINIIKVMNSIEIHFWSNKFLTNRVTKKAWRAFYG